MEGTRESAATASDGVTGAVLVVGGGIAGMQASLDLAEGGFKVYLVEQRSAIGGHMAQLDKTFPTNDCAMCTISPKLVDTGRHLNIEVLTNTDVLSVEGLPGHFDVGLKRRPRYVDETKCTGCGDCEKVCPVEIPSRFDEGLSRQKAIHKLYPQAVPNSYAIEKKGVSPCRDACPAGQRAQGFIALIRKGDYAAAMRTLKLDNPFPGICGRICNHRCEDACNRGLLDEPLNIRALKRFVTEVVYREPREVVPPAERLYPQRVAIIGSGPCGLTAAHDLAKRGYGVTVFEALPVAGGMLRVGVPEYRLPAAIIEREVADVVDLGVELRLNTRVEDIEHVFGEGFDAVLIAVGAHEGVRLPIPGAGLEGVLINTRFLRDVRLGPTPALGSRVLVLGGGNVAIDCARTAVRLGAKVALACLEPRDRMPCHPDEAAAAEAEGVAVHPSRTFLRVVSDGHGKAAGVECSRVARFEFDHVGRLIVDSEPGSEHVIEADTVIFSVGQRAGLALIPEDAGVGITSRRTIAVNPNTMAATRPGVFAAGDSVSGTAFVIEAVASGHRSAQSIHRYLRGEDLEPAPAPRLPVVQFTRAEVNDRVARGEIEAGPRVRPAELEPSTRSESFAEVELPYTEELAQAEAARCLSCAVCSECFSCELACGRGAICHDEVERAVQLQVGAVVLAPGYEVYDASLSQEYGLGRFPNVVTSMQFERLLSASGPTHGHVQRPGDARTPHKIAFLQCVGSRDHHHDYCSSVCCMYAAKEAIMAAEHEPGTEVTVFFMDTRSFSKGYDEYYRRAQEKYGVRYERCRVSRLVEEPATQDLIVRYVSGGHVTEERFELVVLSVGMEIGKSVRELAERLGIRVDDYGFCHTALFAPLESSRPGIFVAGPFREPKDIPETVVEASGAAARAATLLAGARGTLTRPREYPPERDVSSEEPRIGVFVCHCGSNIGGFLDVPAVVDHARGLAGVAHAEANLYTCSQDTVAHITEITRELGLNRVVVASCTPRTHESLFQDAVRAACLNPALFEMANIRNQCSWVHSTDPQGATEKAMDLVGGAVARAGSLAPVRGLRFPVRPSALVLGGGAAGMTAALELADQGYPVHLVERSDRLGGHLLKVRFLESGVPTDSFTKGLISRVLGNARVEVHRSTELLETSGFQGNFRSVLAASGGRSEIQHGAVIVATGGREYRGPEYGLGQHPEIMTGLDFEEFLYRKAGGNGSNGAWELTAPSLPRSLVMILCVGPAERFCARTCCTTAIKNALLLKRLQPRSEITVLYRDMRTYGFKERLYAEARRLGIRFRRYSERERPNVGFEWNSLRIDYRDAATGRGETLRPDLLVLSEPTVPQPDSALLATRLKVPLDADGFFLEAHVKLRPVDLQTNGFYLAGLAHYPKLLSESLAQAQAAAARAATVLSKEELESDGIVAQVDPERCAGCLTCVRACPYGVPRMTSDRAGAGALMGAAYIEPASCHGCGVCAGECPARAILMAHFGDSQIRSLVAGLCAGHELGASAHVGSFSQGGT